MRILRFLLIQDRGSFIAMIICVNYKNIVPKFYCAEVVELKM